MIIQSDVASSKEISKGLVRYNNSKLGKLPFKEGNVYITENGEIKAIAFAGSGWNVIDVEEIWVKDILFLSPLLEKVKEIHVDIAKKVRVFTYDSVYVKHLITLWYDLECTVTGMPKNGNYYVLTNKKPYITNEKYTYNTNESLQTEAEAIIENYKKSLKIEENEYFVYSLKDEGVLVGGVKGSFGNNYVSVDTLWVDETYRGQYLGNKLMTHLEEVAKARGVNNVMLSTCTFQAKDFYEKLGYTVIGVTKDVPLGSDDHFMVKKL